MRGQELVQDTHVNTHKQRTASKQTQQSRLIIHKSSFAISLREAAQPKATQLVITNLTSVLVIS